MNGLVLSIVVMFAGVFVLAMGTAFVVEWRRYS